MQAPSRQVAEAIALLSREGVKLAILFGSRAEGRARPESDWDVAVVAEPGTNLLRLAADLGRTLEGRVDLVDLRRAPPLLGYAALKGQVWLDRTGTEFPRFGSLALRRYWDTAKFRRAQRESLAVFTASRPNR